MRGELMHPEWFDDGHDGWVVAAGTIAFLVIAVFLAAACLAVPLPTPTPLTAPSPPAVICVPIPNTGACWPMKLLGQQWQPASFPVPFDVFNVFMTPTPTVGR